MSLRLGTRGSTLALAQAEFVATLLGGAEVVPIATDDGEPGDKSRFVRGVERALLDGEADLGVHSAKDLPGELPDGLALVGVGPREDPADAFVGNAASLADLPDGARLGTSSLRRRSQLLAARPDLEITDLRGNVDSRLRKLDSDELDGIVLAAAGLARLGRDDAISFRFGADAMVPAAGQGSLALEARSDHEAAATAAASITDRQALIELTAERAVVSALGASCQTPVGVCARHMDGTLALAAFAGMPDGSESIRDAVRGDPDQPGAVAVALIERLRSAGVEEVLARAEAAG